MRALSLRAAQNCEYALKPRCHCRCGGALHGAKRLGDVLGTTYVAPRERFQQLPADDPHHLPTPEEIARKRAATREAYRERGRTRRRLLAQLADARNAIHKWQRWSGPDAPLPQSLTNRLTAIQGELNKLAIQGGAPA